jgi:hypothetical protein
MVYLTSIIISMMLGTSSIHGPDVAFFDKTNKNISFIKMFCLFFITITKIFLMSRYF